MSQILHVGLDDGYNTTIAYTGRNETIITPSRVRIGGSSAITFGAGDDAEKPVQYRTGDNTYSVNAAQSDDTVNDDYPYSGANRVMVHHALGQVRYKDDAMPLHICTGLPIRRYYKSNATPNEEVIDKKTASLKLPVTCIDRNNLELNIARNIVMPESLSAIFDSLYEERRSPHEPHNGNPKVIQHKHKLNEHVAFIDIGGRTTDVAIWAGGRVEKGNFSTLNVGMESIYDDIRDAIEDEFGLPQVPQSIVAHAFKTGSVMLSNRDHEIKQLVDDAVNTTCERIRNLIHTVVGSQAKLLNEVQFIGGGAEALYLRGLSNIYENQRLADDPVVVNARAFYKYLRYAAK